MSSLIKITLISFLILLSFNFAHSARNLQISETNSTLNSSLIHFTPGYDIYVINNLPENNSTLKVHCASKNDELINGILARTTNYHWHFYENIGQTTSYFCHFSWDTQKNQKWALQKRVDVFNEDVAKKVHKRDAWKPNHNVCVWSVQEDGFYFGLETSPEGRTKEFGWI